MWDTEGKNAINKLMSEYLGEKSFYFYFVYHKSHKNYPDLETGRTKWESDV